MSEPEPEPEPFLERLIGFTPDAGGLDRDALLFAAGRRSASARGRRGWMALAALLAGTQALSLVLLWPHPTSTLPMDTPRATLPVARVPAPRAWVNPELWSARPGRLEPRWEDRPPADVTWIESRPPLRAFPRSPSGAELN
jgi:hypothetical protein